MNRSESENSARVDVVIPSGDGTLAAWLYLPEGAQPCPCVVMAHGFTGVRDMQLDVPARSFASEGYAALVFDYRHFGDSSGEPRQLLDLRKQYADWDAAVAFARQRAEIDAAAIVLWGTSFSGGHAIDAAARIGGAAAVIVQAPFVDGLAMAPFMMRRYPRHLLRLQGLAIADQIRAWRRRPPRYVAVAAPAHGLAMLPSSHVWESIPMVVPPGSTWRNEVAARIWLRLPAHRPVRAAKKIKCPVLVQVLDDETVLPTAPARAAARKAPRGEARSYSQLDHFDVYVGAGFERLHRDQLAFLRRVLRQGAAGSS